MCTKKSTNNFKTTNFMVEQKSIEHLNSMECDKLSEHNIVVNGLQEFGTMQKDVYETRVISSRDIKVIAEFPKLENDENIVDEVKNVLYHILQEKIVKTNVQEETNYEQ